MKRLAILIFGLSGLYLVATWLGVPWIVQSQLQAYNETAADEITAQAVHFNPLNWDLSASDVQAQFPGAGINASIRTLTVMITPWHLLGDRIDIAEIILSDPTLTISAADPDQAEAEPAESSSEPDESAPKLHFAKITAENLRITVAPEAADPLLGTNNYGLALRGAVTLAHLDLQYAQPILFDALLEFAAGGSVSLSGSYQGENDGNAPELSEALTLNFDISALDSDTLPLPDFLTVTDGKLDGSGTLTGAPLGNPQAMALTITGFSFQADKLSLSVPEDDSVTPLHLSRFDLQGQLSYPLASAGAGGSGAQGVAAQLKTQVFETTSTQLEFQLDKNQASADLTLQNLDDASSAWVRDSFVDELPFLTRISELQAQIQIDQWVSMLPESLATLFQDETTDPQQQSAAQIQAGMSLKALSLASPETKLLDIASADITGIAATSALDEISISSVTVDAPSAQFVIDANGCINWQLPCDYDNSAEASGKLSVEDTQQTDAQVAGSEAEASAPPTISIKALTISKAALAFVDETTHEPVRLTVQNGKVNLQDLRLPQIAVSDGQFSGDLSPQGSLSVTMQGSTDDLEVGGNIEDLQLQLFSPYTRQYISRDVDEGTLSSSASLKIKEQTLSGQQVLLLHDLRFDRRIFAGESNPPIDLVLSLLTDNRGITELDLPVSGNLADPQFRYSRVIFKAINGLFAGIVSSPFRVLGKLIPDKDVDLRGIRYVAGSANTTEAGNNTTKALRRLLKQRPSLQLSLAAAVAPADLAALSPSADVSGTAVTDLPADLAPQAEPGIASEEDAQAIPVAAVSEEDLRMLLETRLQKAQSSIADGDSTLSDRITLRPIEDVTADATATDSMVRVALNLTTTSE